MPERKKVDEEDRHQHRWYPTGKLAEEKCNCGKVLISPAEEARRIEEWNNYRELVKTTQAYNDYQEMRQAFLARDKKRMKEIDARVMSRNHEVVNEWGDVTIETNDPESLLPKPTFPDPSTWGGYEINVGGG